MIARHAALPAAVAIILVSGCANPDRVLFITKTSIGIDADTAPPTVTIAYDRMDGYLGPRYDNGAVPPVVSSIKTDLAVFAPQIKQVYATGQAARNVTSTTVKEPQSLPLTGGKKLMFFGTSTTVGLKVGFSETGAPSSITLGFKRKEVSVIPLGTIKDKDGKDVDAYPSVLASLDMRVRAASFQDTSLAMSQFFATGDAAEALAQEQTVRDNFKLLAQNALHVAKAVPEGLQKRRENVSAFVKSLQQSDLDSLANALGKQTGDAALPDILSSISAAETPADLNVITDKVKELFHKEF